MRVPEEGTFHGAFSRKRDVSTLYIIPWYLAFFFFTHDRRLERHKRFARGRQGLMAKESGGPILDRGAAGNSQRYRKFVTPVQAFSLAGDALFWRVFLLSSREMCPRTNHQQLFRYHAGISIAGPGWRSEVPREGRRRARWRKDLTQRPDR